MENRIKKLRENRGLTQACLAEELGITQQMLSKYEQDTSIIKGKLLRKLAEYFNVTTDFILDLTDIKRDLAREMRVTEAIDMYYDLIELYNKLDVYDQELFCSILRALYKRSEKHRQNVKYHEA